MRVSIYREITLERYWKSVCGKCIFACRYMWLYKCEVEKEEEKKCETVLIFIFALVT